MSPYPIVVIVTIAYHKPEIIPSTIGESRFNVKSDTEWDTVELIIGVLLDSKLTITEMKRVLDNCYRSA